MDITTELLKKVYLRAEQYAIARWNKTPDRIEIQDDGTIRAVWELCYSGECDYDYEYISVENLTEDLDAVIEIRKKEEEEARKAHEIRMKEIERQRQLREQEQRKQQYLKLKQEFEPSNTVHE